MMLLFSPETEMVKAAAVKNERGWWFLACFFFDWRNQNMRIP